MNGKANGANAANAKRSPEERKALARKMAQMKKHLASLPKSGYKGSLHIADMTFNCCVLDDGRRLMGVSGFLCLGRLFQGQPNEAALCI